MVDLSIFLGYASIATFLRLPYRCVVKTMVFSVGYEQMDVTGLKKRRKKKKSK